jgi:2-oxoglutarate dehydrogenase E2 component (dihydrolipoamide succinyltransferase)
MTTASTPVANLASLTEVTMPQLGETVAEGTVTRWLKSVGEHVALDEPLLEVSTDKVDTEVGAPATGVLAEILVTADETVEVGAVLGLIDGGTGRTNTAEVNATVNAQASPLVATGNTQGGVVYASTQVLLEDAARPRPGSRHSMSPRRRRDAVQPALPVIASPTAQPTADWAGPPIVAAPGDRAEPTSWLRRDIADRIVASLQTTAQLTMVVEADVTEVAAILASAKAAGQAGQGAQPRLTYSAFFAKAVVDALKRHPLLNASIADDGHTVNFHGAQHLGIAVDTDHGLVVPVIRDAADLNVSGLARLIADVAARARANKLGPDELSGGTFTITNTGSRGALFDTPILNTPQVGILGTGSVVERAQVVRDTAGRPVIAIRSMAYLALSYDHRLVDGADAARFLTTVRELVESWVSPRSVDTSP